MRAAALERASTSETTVRRRATTPRSRARAHGGKDANGVTSPVEASSPVDGVASRRALLASGALACVAMTSDARRARATSNGTISDAWETITGAPGDVAFPASFRGNWLATSVGVSVDAPLGTEYVTDVRNYERARADVGREEQYPVRFVENRRGEVVFDRAFNVEALARSRDGSGGKRAVDDVEWDVNDPNVLKMTTGEGSRIFYKVTARSFERDDEKRTLTSSELAQIVVDRPGAGGAPSVKSTRIVTKYKWRTPVEARDGPQIVASQTIYDYLTPVGAASDASSEDADELFVRALGRPVLVSVYRVAMIPWPDELLVRA